jgi:UDP-N-acetylmuramoyl-tripeptide--D-alanyl-D-alanine ligase
MATVEAVAAENGSVIDALDAQGVAVFPADDVYTAMWQKMAGTRKVLTFAVEGPAGVTADARWVGSSWQVRAATPLGAVEFTLSSAGRHNVKNALAAMACALAAGAPVAGISAGLTAFVPVKGRSRAAQVMVQGRLLNLIDDTYNANPDSLRAAIELLAELSGPRLLVMGDMAEVGEQGPQFHEEAGSLALASGIDKLFTLGTQSARAASSFGQGRHFKDMDTLNAAVLAELPHLGSILVKGSRSMNMERVVQAISATRPTHPGAPHAA